jgi:hypothetical protein
MATTLAVTAVVVCWRMRRNWREQLTFARLEWVALAVFAMTVFTRLWMVGGNGYPAWTDSLHHVLLTDLTASQGQLPVSMEPYLPIPLDRYHLGLYSLSGTVQWLTQVPSHTALLLTAQVLNGLCGLGVYLVLDRRVGRLGAILGALVVGLASHQPAYYVNWGRFTQIAGQTILLGAWVLAEEALSSWRTSSRWDWREVVWNTLCAAGLTAAVFLLHLRVGLFLSVLLAIGAVPELLKGYKTGRLSQVALGLLSLTSASLVFAGPGLFGAVLGYVEASQVSPSTVAESTAQSLRTYYDFPLSGVPYLVGSWWLTVGAAICALVGAVRRDRLALTSA